jgi:hypothetical protein
MSVNVTPMRGMEIFEFLAQKDNSALMVGWCIKGLENMCKDVETTPDIELFMKLLKIQGSNHLSWPP